VAQESAFGELLRQYRRSAGMSQEELAEQATLSVRAISDLERGLKYRPRRDTVQLLANALALEGAAREEFQRLARSVRNLPVVTADDVAPENLPAPTPLTNLPNEPTPFIGREREIAALTAVLQQSRARLVTLTGPGGSGKTRLALEVAAAQLGTYPDGIFLVSLAPLTDPELVAPTLAAVLGIKGNEHESLPAAIRRGLREKHLLLVLDNFEHLLDAAPLVGDLVRGCPSLQILVTSRAILRLSAEHEFPVSPLTLPDLHQRQDLAHLSRYDAVALFVARARAVRPEFLLTEENAASVAAICHRLDGLPLALELAAVRIRLLPPPALLARLSRRLDLLTGGPHDLPNRQRTLRATMDWSYGLLGPEEQLLFARVSVFAGGCTLEAVEAVCRSASDSTTAVLDRVASLVEKSLVRQEGEEESRFVMLETIREYAAEKLEEQGEAPEILRRHALYFMAFAEAIRPQLDGPGQVEGLDRLEREHNNLRAAVEWACVQGEVEVGLRLAIASEYLYMRGHGAEIAKWFETILALEARGDKQINASLRAEGLQLAAAYALWNRGDTSRSRELTEECIALIDELTDRRDIAYRLQGTGQILAAHGDYARASSLLERALPLFAELDDKAGLGVVLKDLGNVARQQGDTERLVQLFVESLRFSREVGNATVVAEVLGHLGLAARMLGDLDRARALHGEALELARQVGTAWVGVGVLISLATIEREAGALAEAETLLTEALELCREECDVIQLSVESLEGMAGVAAARGRAEGAAVLFGAVHALRERIGTPMPPVNRPAYERDLAAVRATLGVERFTRAWDEGAAMTADQALAYALGEARAAHSTD
jgi:predicted ATPase/DNA-binding XRE family transcriptional regulator